MFKKNWFTSWPLKSTTNKQLHSLDNLKILYNVLFKNQTVSEQNKHLLVETLRSIAEILIWGDQNDSTVFDFFLEKNMLSFFLKIMKQQRCGSYVCVQLLQTLNILFENIRDETSLYYLLSNNHVNSIIIHKFDFSDEEVMAYYISFLKTLSFKLNDHTIHFFYNENTNDFPLYTEAIKFFNHQEKMVRIAVRTISLNVFRIDEQSMLKFVSDHTAVPFFSNLVWFIGNHILEIDNCLKKEIKDQQMLIKLDDLVAEHLDHLHYLNDILLLRINNLNEILTDHLLNRLLIPLYIYSLIYDDDNNYDNYNQFNINNSDNNSNLISNTTTISTTTSNSNSNQNQNSLFSSSINQSPIHKQFSKQQSTISSSTYKDRPKISRIVSLFLLSQIFLIISYDSLVQQLINLILYGNFNIFDKPQFIAPLETLEESLVNNLLNRSSSSKLIYDTDNYNENNNDDNNQYLNEVKINNEINNYNENNNDNDNQSLNEIKINNEINNSNKTNLTDDLIFNQDLLKKNDLNKSLKEDLNKQIYSQSNSEQIQNLLMNEFLKDKPFLEALFNSFDCTIQKDDHLTVFSLSLLYVIIFNTGIKKSQIRILKNEDISPIKDIKLITDQLGSSKLIDHLTQIINLSGTFDSFIRPITLELCSLLLIKLCIRGEEEDNDNEDVNQTINKIRLSDHHLAIIEQTKENSTSIVRNYFRNENEQLFLDLFEDEFMEFSKFKINVEYLMMDANLLIPPNQLQPLMVNNLHFTRRLPYSDIEKARYAIRVFFIIRNLSMKITNQNDDNQLPLTNTKNLVSINDNIDLNNCNLVHCFLQIKNQNKEEGYIVILDEQLVFIEPNNQRGIGSVSAKYTANLQNIDVYLDKDDSRSLLVTIRPNAANGSQTKFGAIDLNNLKTTTSSKHSNTNLKLLFDDYIRCKVTEQHITRGKQNVIQRKLRKIANLIDIELDNNQIQQSNSNSFLNFNNQSQQQITKQRNNNHHHLQRTLRYSNSSNNGLPIPGVAKITFKSTNNQTTNQNRSSNLISSLNKKSLINRKSSSLSSTSKNSRDNSPKTEKLQNLKQEICEMKDLSPKSQHKKFTINLPSKTINLEETSD